MQSFWCVHLLGQCLEMIRLWITFDFGPLMAKELMKIVIPIHFVQ